MLRVLSAMVLYLMFFVSCGRDNPATPILTDEQREKGYVFVSEWGGSYYNFWDPRGIAVDSLGNVYVVDAEQHCVKKFTSEGVFLTKWGERGSGNGTFSYPKGIAVDNSGSVYVADDSNYRIQKFNSDGGFLTAWGDKTQFPGPVGPVDITTDGLRNVYVNCWEDNRIQKFTPDGTLLTQWTVKDLDNPDSILGKKLRTYPTSIAADTNGNVYVIAYSPEHTFFPVTKCVEKFTSEGVFMGNIGEKEGGLLINPTRLEVDKAGNVYIVDGFGYTIGGGFKKNPQVKKFTLNGTLVAKADVHVKYWTSHDIAVDSSGNIYIADSEDRCIRKYRPL